MVAVMTMGAAAAVVLSLSMMQGEGQAQAFRRTSDVDADQIYVEVWVDDPKVLMKPYRRGMTFTRVWQPGYEQLEYACHEGNRAVDIIMEGAENLKRPPGKRK